MGYQESPVGESKSNGAAENAVQQIQKHTRVIRDGLEARYQQKVAGDHMCMAWLARHAGGVKSRLQVGPDGKTAYERLKGKKFGREWVEFGECVWFLLQSFGCAARPSLRCAPQRGRSYKRTGACDTIDNRPPGVLKRPPLMVDV